jgi:uncharacterized DUF497 family protein
MKIIWDEPKRIANLDKHGMDFADLNEKFFDTALVLNTYGKRYRAIGEHSRRRFRDLRRLWHGGGQRYQHAPG